MCHEWNRGAEKHHHYFGQHIRHHCWSNIDYEFTFTVHKYWGPLWFQRANWDQTNLTTGQTLQVFFSVTPKHDWGQPSKSSGSGWLWWVSWSRKRSVWGREFPGLTECKMRTCRRAHGRPSSASASSPGAASWLPARCTELARTMTRCSGSGTTRVLQRTAINVLFTYHHHPRLQGRLRPLRTTPKAYYFSQGGKFWGFRGARGQWSFHPELDRKFFVRLKMHEIHFARTPVVNLRPHDAPQIP